MAGRKGLEIFSEGVEYIFYNEGEIRDKYGGKVYLAIQGGYGVIDSDKDKSALEGRVGSRRGVLIDNLDDIMSMIDELTDSEEVH